MTLLPPQTIAFLYQSGIDRICDAYHASASALEVALNAANQAATTYLQSGSDDSEYEYDGEHRILVYSTQHALDQAALDITLSARVVREAFIISAFHYWESWSRSLTKLNGRNDNYTVLKKSMAAWYSIDVRLDLLAFLTNLLKHGDGAFHHARALAAVRPALFMRLPGLFGNWALSVSDETVHEAFDIIRSAGPR